VAVPAHGKVSSDPSGEYGNAIARTRDAGGSACPVTTTANAHRKIMKDAPD
jgi:hypothetical protein